jgi:hypothetical protein
MQRLGFWILYLLFFALPVSLLAGFAGLLVIGSPVFGFVVLVFLIWHGRESNDPKWGGKQ